MRNTVYAWLVVLACTLGTAAWAWAAEDDSKAAVVKIVAEGAQGRQTGTGFIVRLTADSVYIVTAAHVLSGSKQVEVVFNSRRTAPVPARTVGADDRNDLALLEVRGKATSRRSGVALARRYSRSEERRPAHHHRLSRRRRAVGGDPGHLRRRGRYCVHALRRHRLGQFRVAGPQTKPGSWRGHRSRPAICASRARGNRRRRPQGLGVSLAAPSQKSSPPPRQPDTPPVRETHTDVPVAPAPPPAAINLTGQYYGQLQGWTASGQQYSCGFALVMSQTGMSVSGQYQNTCGDQGVMGGR